MNETKHTTISERVLDYIRAHEPISAARVEKGIGVKGIAGTITHLRKMGKIVRCGNEPSDRRDAMPRALYRVVTAEERAASTEATKQATPVRKSFVFYTEWAESFEGLPAEMRGKCYDAIVTYAASGQRPADAMIAAITRQMCNVIDRDTEKYIKTSEKRSEAGRRGMASRWGLTNQAYSVDNKIVNNKLYQTITKITDNDNDNDNDNVCVYDTHAHTHSYEKYIEWLSRDCPHVAAMEQQMTEQQYTSYVTEYGKDVLFQISRDMENRQGIESNRSVYMTARKWAKRQK